MKKNLGAKTLLFPMPVLIIATYNDDGTPNAMNAAWGGIYDDGKIGICISDTHKTFRNVKARKAFTVSIADAAHVKEADYVGVVSGDKDADKFAKSGFTAVKSVFVDAPVINELPLTLECKLWKINEDGITVGEIVNVSADERIVGEGGRIDVAKLDPITFDTSNLKYRRLGEEVGRAFSDGLSIGR